MHISVIDDNKKDREHLSLMIRISLEKYGFLVSHIKTFESGEAFLKDFDQEKYDLIFLDIYMEGLNGIETARQIREKDTRVKLIFITCTNDFASESYQVRADYYLLKPYNEKELEQAISRLGLNSIEKERTITLPDRQVIWLDSIIYTNFSGHYVTIYLLSGEQIRVRCTQNEWEKCILPFSKFILCTRGIIVNLEEVEKLESDLFIMKNNTYIPISRRKYSEVKQAYSAFLIQKARRRKLQ